MKYTKKCGFTILEFLIYFSLVVTVTMLTMQFIVSSYRKIMKYSTVSHTMSMVCLAHDLLIADLYRYYSDASVWTVSRDNYYRWSGESDIEWRVKKGRLMRSIGSYDQEDEEWNEVVKTTIADNIAEIIVTPRGNQIDVSITAKNLQYTLTRTIHIKNRKV